ncbi:MAG: ABC transporter permease [Pseudonocardiales bacterium]|nr:MAG: ABC transporter permease [Pseudonocardiales bacterium]
MKALPWLAGLCRRRPFELLGAAVSIALAVAFIAALGGFVSDSTAGLTTRAAARVPVDWQVQVTPQGHPADVAATLARTPGVRAVLPVRMAIVPALQSSSATGSRTTGQAYVVSLDPGYAEAAPAEVRYLLGAHDGILLQQQTAANLAAGPGSTVTVSLPGGGQKALKVDGVADLPQADSFFQVVGAPPGAGATAPPDNVLLVPPPQFAALTGGATVIRQFHVLFGHAALPHDPAAAAALLTQRANHFQAQVAGGALVGDNLGAALSAAREDALYAQLLILLLGVPGLALAAVVAALVVALRGERRRREVALLRLRGARPAQILRIVAAETALTGGLGVLLGLPLAVLAVWLALPAGAHLALGWTVGATVAGLLMAAATQLGPAVRSTLRPGAEGIGTGVARVQPTGLPWPLRLGLDAVLLAGAVAVFALTARGGYQVVVVPEGVPVATVNYAALLAPALAWPGLALLIWRISIVLLGRRTGRFAFSWAARSGPGRAPEMEAAVIRARRRVIARGAAGLAVALGLAASTAIFTATYDKQARLDVALTVGADVAVTQPPGAVVGPGGGTALAGAPGVQAVEPLQHRLAYVGADLQDLYGIRPATIGRVAPLLDSFVPGSTIRTALHSLTTTPDGVLLAAETIHDYQLHPGDAVRLRLQTGPGHTYTQVGFHVVGVVREFPTAPKDSFIIANAAYIAKVTGSDAVGTFLIRSSTPTTTAAALRQSAAPGVQVHDIVADRAAVTSASGLASADLSGLSHLELGFGLILALACSGLALALGITERRRALVLLAALGATSRQRGRFLTAEARALLAGGLVGGAVIGTAIAYLLVKILTGIFDPAPTGLTIPAQYLSALVLSVLAASAAVLVVFGRLAGRAGPSQLRDL